MMLYYLPEGHFVFATLRYCDCLYTVTQIRLSDYPGDIGSGFVYKDNLTEGTGGCIGTFDKCVQASLFREKESRTFVDQWLIALGGGEK